MTYNTTIPDGFVPPQFRDDRFIDALERYSRRHRAAGPNIIALPRPELDPSSRVHYSLGTGSSYEIDAKTDRVAMMHVLSAGPGRVRLGYREQVPVSTGDMVLVNLREAGHWLHIEGVLCYTFTSDVAMARVYRTDKPEVYNDGKGGQSMTLQAEARARWQDALFWNLRDVLNDYVVLGRDPNAEVLYRKGPGTLIEVPDSVLSEGTTSDDGRNKRFPIVYRRVLGAGPGRGFRRESDLGFPDYVHSRSEAEPGDMIAYTTSVRAATLTFQGMPLEIIHAASVLDVQTDRVRVEVHESVPVPIPWDVPNETDRDEDDQLRGRTG